MSHIIKSEEDIKMMSQQLEKLRSKGYTNNVLEGILNTIIPNNTSLPIEAIIGESQKPAFFNEKKQKIEICPESLKSYLNKQIYWLIKLHPELEKDIFDNYMLLTLAHEVEHYYQCLIANEYVDFPYKIVVDGYKNLTLLKLDKNINPIYALIKLNRFYNYQNNADSLLERNANLEAYDLLFKVANYENNKEMLKILRDQLFFQLSLGYKDHYNGSMEKTYRKKWMNSIYQSLDHTEDIPIEDKVRYGLPIDKETRKKILKKQFNI